MQSDCNETLLGNDDEFIDRLNDSFSSNILLSIIEILLETLISPVGTTMSNGPDSKS